MKKSKKTKQDYALPRLTREHIETFVYNIKLQNQQKTFEEHSIYEGYEKGANLSFPSSKTQQSYLVTPSSKKYPIVELPALNRKGPEKKRQVYRHEVDKWITAMHKLALQAGFTNHEWYQYVPGGKFNPVVKMTVAGTIPVGLQFYFVKNQFQSIYDDFDCDAESQLEYYQNVVSQYENSLESASSSSSSISQHPDEIKFMDNEAQNCFDIKTDSPLFSYFWDVDYTLVCKQEGSSSLKILFTIQHSNTDVNISKNDIVHSKQGCSLSFSADAFFYTAESTGQKVFIEIKQFQFQAWISVNILVRQSRFTAK